MGRVAGRGGPWAAWLGPTDRALAPLDTRLPSAPAEWRGDCSARSRHRKRASGTASHRLPGAAALGASGFGPGDSGTVPAACGRASALGRSKVQGQAVPGRARAPGPAARPAAPRVPAREVVRRERSAYHGTWSAGGGRGHHDRSCSTSGLSQPMVTARTLVCAEVPGGRLCGWFLCPTPRPLFHPSQGGRHTPRPGSALCLS